jgi:hypothetical protein
MTPHPHPPPTSFGLVVPRLRGIGALMAGALLLVAIPRPAAAQLAWQTFEVNLGSGAIPGPLPFDEPFFLSGPAPENLLQVRLWALRTRLLKPGDCSRVTPASTATETSTPAAAKVGTARIPMVLTSSWSRAGLDSITRFELQAGPLSPNRDYTFCLHLLRRPTAADSVAFGARATRNLTAALEAMATGAVTSAETLDSLQAALIRALPAADSIEFLGSETIFRAPTNESSAAKADRLKRLLVLEGDYLRISLLRKAAEASEAAQVLRAGQALSTLFHNPTLWRLVGTYETSVPSGLDRTRLRVAAYLAARLSQFDANDADLIAEGLFPLDGSPAPGRSRNVPAASKSELRTYLDSLSQTQSLLRDIAALAALAKGSHRADTAGGPSREELDRLTADLSVAVTEISGEMQDLVLITERLDERAAAVQQLVTSVRTLDFARIALRSTTSDTYKARANWYIGLDAGILGARDVRKLVPYFGANLYFRPVNKNAPLGRCFCFLRRASLTLGVTAASVAEKDRIEDTFSNHSILTGVGFRLTDYWRISGGLLVVRTYDADKPGELRTGALPSLATSLDIDIVGLLGKVGSALLP